MAEPKPRRATYQDVLDAPEHQVAEIVNGALFLSPRPALAHAAVSSALGGELGPPFSRGRGGPGGWIMLDEPELHLDADILVPDLGGWRRERLPGIDAAAAYFTLPPDWVCEVLSPSTEQIDRALKLPLYAAAGVNHAWLIHPRNRTLEVLRLHDGMWLVVAVHRENERVRAEPFDAIELDMSVLWQDLILPPTPRAAERVALYEPAG
jgi:Uma2 family endonuclease